VNNQYANRIYNQKTKVKADTAMMENFKLGWLVLTEIGSTRAKF